MIKVTGISKSYGQELVLDTIGFELPMRKTLSILGASGSGKSTLLKILAGIEKADAGSFLWEEKELLSLTPQKRGVVYLSQDPLLFPHMTVFQNLAYGLEVKGMGRSEIIIKVEEMASSLGLSEHLSKLPQMLSGGQKQRVSFGRAMIISPRILLLDEPFGSLDAGTRQEMQHFYKEVRELYNITSLFVTHDIKEAILMGDKIATLTNQSWDVFDSVKEYMKSPDSKVLEEIAFWKNLEKDK